MALDKPEDIEALADGLSDMADAMHKRLLKAIKGAEIELAEVQTQFQREALLRQKANALYADAAGAVVEGLPLAQSELLKVVQIAEERIQSIEDLRKGMEIFGDILVLSASVMAGKPGPILAAVKEIQDDLG